MGGVTSYLLITDVNGNENLQINDIIYYVDDKQVTTHSSLVSILSYYAVGDEVELKVARTTGRTTKIYSYKVTLTEDYPLDNNN